MSLLPAPPVATDNLYKFIALAGLLLCVASIAGIEAKQSVVDGRLEEIGLQIAEYDAEEAAYDSRIKRLESVSRPTPADIAALDSSLDRMVRLNKLASGRLKIVHELRERSAVDVRGIFFLEAVGAGAAFVGFGLWYQRLQKYLDAEVRANAKLLEVQTEGGTPGDPK